MNWNVAETNWTQFRGDVRAHWHKLTDSQLDGIAGRRAQLADTIRAAYGVTSDAAEQQIKSFEARNEHSRPVSSR